MRTGRPSLPPRPGRRTLLAAGSAGGAAGLLGLLGWGVLAAEARLARRRIGDATDSLGSADGRYGRYPGPALRLAVLGDSGARGLGCDLPAETPGALLAGGLARELHRTVTLRVHAVTGARSADLEIQVAKALTRPVDLAVIMIGANDVTHRVSPGTAAKELGRAVQSLRAAGASVVVGTCPDLGTVEPVLQPLRAAARLLSRQMARAQAAEVVENDGVAVSLGDLLGPEFAKSPQLFSPDRFHPSAAGYRRVADALLPHLLAAAGVDVPATGSVQDVDLAAAQTAGSPGLAMEPVAGPEGIATPGPGRLTRLVRRLPLLGRGEPEPRSGSAGEAQPAPAE